MNYIFLDVDGVLNNKKYLLAHKDDDGTIDPENIELLAKLAHEFNCHIILSSSWKNGFKENLEPKYKTIQLFDKTEIPSRCQRLLNSFKEYNLKLEGLTPNVVTPQDITWSRPFEIQKYIRTNLKENDNFVILDDDDDICNSMLKMFPNHFIQTNFETGFNLEHYDKAVKILNKEA